MTNKHYSKRGFTIVEILIVIVIIGILATITIVAYNGVQNNARKATVMSDLDNATSILELSLKQNGSYPATKEVADNGNPLPASKGTTYQYTVNTSTTSPSYCLTGTNGTSTYNISSITTTPSVGGCPGHGTGGIAAVTNLATNPSFELALTGWSGYYSPTRTQTLEDSMYGSYSQKIVNQSTTQSNGTYFVVTRTYTAGATIRASIWVKGLAGVPLVFGFRSPTQLGSGYGTNSFVTTGSWQRVEISYVLPVTPDAWYAPQLITRSPLPAIGTVIYCDGLMFVEGTIPANYADGSTSSSWLWNGTPHASTSTGPAL